MVSVYDLAAGPAHLGAFFVWTLAVAALAKAVFGSFPAAEIRHRLALREAPRRNRMARLRWELNTRSRFSDEAARGSPHASQQPLTDAEIARKAVELQELSRTTLAQRAVTYLFSCWACQTFWTALAVYAVTRGPWEVGAWVFTAAAHSGAAVVIAALVGSPAGGEASRPTSRSRCKHCGS
ncbi:MAG: hypothetical protein AB1716_01070 [Planctomycetota bacterium]